MLRRRPYLSVELCRKVLGHPIARAIQPDGRLRWWGRVRLPDDERERILRVVTLEDGATIHNAFLDRGLREDG